MSNAFFRGGFAWVPLAAGLVGVIIEQMSVENSCYRPYLSVKGTANTNC